MEQTVILRVYGVETVEVIHKAPGQAGAGNTPLPDQPHTPKLAPAHSSAHHTPTQARSRLSLPQVCRRGPQFVQTSKRTASWHKRSSYTSQLTATIRLLLVLDDPTQYSLTTSSPSDEW